MKLVEMLKSELPEYSIKIPSIDNDLLFRPFLVKEEKTLLLVSEEGNMTDILRTVKNILESCFTDLDLSSITLAEAEYLFLKLREKSVGEKLELMYKDTGSSMPYPITVELNKVKVPKRTKKLNDSISITEKINITLSDITLNDVIKENVQIYNPTQDDIIKILSIMIKTINVGEETLTGSDISIKEKIDFIENMTEKQLEKILTFYTNAPSLDHKFKHTINDEEKEFELKGLNDFFGLVSLT